MVCSPELEPRLRGWRLVFIDTAPVGLRVGFEFARPPPAAAVDTAARLDFVGVSASAKSAASSCEHTTSTGMRSNGDDGGSPAGAAGAVESTCDPRG